jgi:hypothetical protein
VVEKVMLNIGYHQDIQYGIFKKFGQNLLAFRYGVTAQ